MGAEKNKLNFDALHIKNKSLYTKLTLILFPDIIL